MSEPHDPPELKTVYRVCSACEGKGTVERLVLTRPRSFDDPYDVLPVKCEKCDGLGEVSREMCSRCERPEYSDHEPFCECWQRDEETITDVLELVGKV